MKGQINYTFRASIRIFGGDIPHDDICEALGVTAKLLYRKGEPKVSPKGQVLDGVYPSDYCVIDLAPGSDLSLPDFIDQQARTFIAHKELFQKIRKGSARTEFFIGWFGPGNFGAEFGSDTFALMGKLGIDLSLDIYTLPEDYVAG